MTKRILIVNVNWVGDIIFSTPFIRTVRMANPDARIACLVHPRCVGMLESNPRLDEIIIYDEEGSHKGVIGKAGLVFELRKGRFDTAFILHRSFTKALLTWMAGIPERVGYATKNRGGILTTVVEDPETECHKVEYFLNIARAAGMKPDSLSYEFFVEPSDRAFVAELLAKNGITGKDKVVVLCPGGNWDPKRWPKERFASLADLLTEKAAARIVISGSAKDVALAQEVKGLMKNSSVVTAGETTLRQLGALLGRADLVVANDSGPMHIAVAMKTKTIALFGPTSPRLTGPYGEGSYIVIEGKAGTKEAACEVPCYDVSCGSNDCMKGIDVADVMGKAMEMLG